MVTDNSGSVENIAAADNTTTTTAPSDPPAQTFPERSAPPPPAYGQKGKRKGEFIHPKRPLPIPDANRNTDLSLPFWRSQPAYYGLFIAEFGERAVKGPTPDMPVLQDLAQCVRGCRSEARAIEVLAMNIGVLLDREVVKCPDEAQTWHPENQPPPEPKMVVRTAEPGNFREWNDSERKRWCLDVLKTYDRPEVRWDVNVEIYYTPGYWDADNQKKCKGALPQDLGLSEFAEMLCNNWIPNDEVHRTLASIEFQLVSNEHARDLFVDHAHLLFDDVYFPRSRTHPRGWDERRWKWYRPEEILEEVDGQLFIKGMVYARLAGCLYAMAYDPTWRATMVERFPVARVLKAFCEQYRALPRETHDRAAEYPTREVVMLLAVVRQYCLVDGVENLVAADEDFMAVLNDVLERGLLHINVSVAVVKFVLAFGSPSKLRAGIRVPMVKSKFEKMMRDHKAAMENPINPHHRLGPISQDYMMQADDPRLDHWKDEQVFDSNPYQNHWDEECEPMDEE